MAPKLDDYAAIAERRFGSEDGAGPDGRGDRPRPKVSLITVCLNARATLDRTITSIRRQSFTDFEHVVVDGGSTDGTIELIKARLRPQDYWISEEDRGISDAFNKGVALAAGEYVQFVNADDWLSPDQLEHAVAAIENSGADFVFGDLIFYEDERPSFRYAGDASYAAVIAARMPSLNHPTVLARRSAFERIGLFDPAYRCAMDYDWFLRLHRAGGKGFYDPGILGHMTHDGVSNNQYERTIREVQAISVANGRRAGLAAAEAKFRLCKTWISRPLKRSAKPLYQLVRRTINKSYAPTTREVAHRRHDRP